MPESKCSRDTRCVRKMTYACADLCVRFVTVKTRWSRSVLEAAGVADEPHCEFTSRAESQFGQDMLHMRRGCARGDVHRVGDLAVAESTADQRRDFALTRCEQAQLRRWNVRDQI